MKAEDNKFPYVTVTKGAAPAVNPDAGSVRLFVDTADGKTKQLASDGSVSLVGGGPRTINAQVGTTYTLALTDAGNDKFLTMNNAAASTVVVPPNSAVPFPVGSVVDGAQLGAGQVTLTPGAGVTINASPGLKVAAQYGVFALLKIGTDTWLAMGRLAA